MLTSREGTSTILLTSSSLSHPPCTATVAFRGARAAGRPLWPQLLATPAHEAELHPQAKGKTGPQSIFYLSPL